MNPFIVGGPLGLFFVFVGIYAAYIATGKNPVRTPGLTVFEDRDAIEAPGAMGCMLLVLGAVFGFITWIVTFVIWILK